jgi:hypothetical protein
MNFERLFRKVIITLLVLGFLPQIYLLIVHIVHEVVAQPSPVPSASGVPVQRIGGFGAGVLVTILILLMVVGLLTRIGRALRNPDAARYRAALDRRARTLPRYSAEADEVGPHGAGPAPVDDDPELPWD